MPKAELNSQLSVTATTCFAILTQVGQEQGYRLLAAEPPKYIAWRVGGTWSLVDYTLEVWIVSLSASETTLRILTSAPGMFDWDANGVMGRGARKLLHVFQVKAAVVLAAENAARENRGDTYIGEYVEEYIMGDRISVRGSGNVLVNRSIVHDALAKVRVQSGDGPADALVALAREIDQAGNKQAAEKLETLAAELVKPKPNKTLLRTMWEGILAAAPLIKELPAVVKSIEDLIR